MRWKQCNSELFGRNALTNEPPAFRHGAQHTHQSLPSAKSKIRCYNARNICWTTLDAIVIHMRMFDVRQVAVNRLAKSSATALHNFQINILNWILWLINTVNLDAQMPSYFNCIFFLFCEFALSVWRSNYCRKVVAPIWQEKPISTCTEIVSLISLEWNDSIWSAIKSIANFNDFLGIIWIVD